MREDEDITSYLLHVDEIVNTIKGLGETIDEKFVVQKVLRTLPSRFDPKISSIEEMKDLDSLTMDELHGILTAYEMRTVQENPSKHEATFKASKGTSSKGHQTYDSSEEESDAEGRKLRQEAQERNWKIQR
jgi:hypothetical protein